MSALIPSPTNCSIQLQAPTDLEYASEKLLATPWMATFGFWSNRMTKHRGLRFFFFLTEGVCDCCHGHGSFRLPFGATKLSRAAAAGPPGEDFCLPLCFFFGQYSACLWLALYRSPPGTRISSSPKKKIKDSDFLSDRRKRRIVEIN